MSARELITEHLDLWTGAVTHKSSAGRGRNGKIELTGIKKLRELILELAVRGKLVEQDPNDEPASVLLERIAEEKARLVKEGRIRKPRMLPEITEEEMPFELPEGWSWARLGNISQINPRNDADDEIIASFIPMPMITTSFHGEHEQEARSWREIKKGYTHFADGDIAIAKITPCFENSKAAVFRNLESGIGAGTTELHVARPYEGTLNQLFILLCLKSPRFLSNGENKMTGSAGQKRVPKDFFAGEPLPFPPLAEQNRIVEKVDELMALCDRLEQQVGDQLEAHEVLVDTLLDALISSADAAEVAKNWARIAEHFDTLFTTEASIDKLKVSTLDLAAKGRLVPFYKDEKPLKKILSFGPRNGFSPKECNHATGYKALKLGATTKGKLDLNESKNVEVDVDNSSHLWLRHGDILIQRGNASSHVGCNVMISEDHPGFIYPDLMMKIRVKEEADPRFISLYLSAPKSRQFMWKRMTGTSGTMPKISKKVVEAIPIALPDMATQQATIEKVDELMALCDQLKARLSEVGETRTYLAEAVVEQAVQ
ncbi:restriction endonuclease subunit S [Halomonas lysinitropha]|uniref:Type-1 restriction enzyme EcoKI specificity protein n=1 Tax=Halomonas lysinitropha TaxID=2607506 RepID=A0A5K1HYF3_9GAMM|nr:restriction endonuclease subunit S [Halomonas lysinitropha]VVZ94574.1 Type-1 restriction enzyme EcoKI specificity protein [Halomonas lysinitropha]